MGKEFIVSRPGRSFEELTAYLRGVKGETFEELCVLAPGLKGLYKMAQLIKKHDTLTRPKRFCANEVWADYFDATLEELVGWYARDCDGNTAHMTSKAYELAYLTIYNVLPNCRNCGCA